MYYGDHRWQTMERKGGRDCTTPAFRLEGDEMDTEKYQMEMTARTANFVARTTPVPSRARTTIDPAEHVRAGFEKQEADARARYEYGLLWSHR